MKQALGSMRFHTLILDFDSTLVQVESLELLAQISLATLPNRRERYQQIKALTEAAMEGKISFAEALEKRIQLLQAYAHHLPVLIDQLRQLYTPSLLRNLSQLLKPDWDVYVFSGGFIEFIVPVLHPLGFAPDRIFANRFVANAQGKIIGVDPSVPLAGDEGKVRLAQQLNLRAPILVVGDGYNDYELRKARIAQCFAAFVENVRRPPVVAVADWVVESFDHLMEGVQQCAEESQ